MFSGKSCYDISVAYVLILVDTVNTCTLPKTNIAPENGLPKRKFIFQLSIFRGHVSFREGTYPIKCSYSNKLSPFQLAHHSPDLVNLGKIYHSPRSWCGFSKPFLLLPNSLCCLSLSPKKTGSASLVNQLGGGGRQILWRISGE